MTCKDYIYNILIGIDQLVNCFLAGYPDETISSRTYRLSLKSKFGFILKTFIDFLFRPWGSDHCKASYKSELARNHLFEASGLARTFGGKPYGRLRK